MHQAVGISIKTFILQEDHVFARHLLVRFDIAALQDGRGGRGQALSLSVRGRRVVGVGWMLGALGVRVTRTSERRGTTSAVRETGPGRGAGGR